MLMTNPNQPSDMQRALSIERETKTRIGAQGELSFYIGSLMQELRSLHLISQIDRLLEFPNPDVLKPDVFSDKKIDSVFVTLGELHVGEDLLKHKKARTETHLSLRLQSGNETLVVTRSSDPGVDPDDIQDYIVVTGPSSDGPQEIMYLKKKVSDVEINSILISLVATSAQSAEKFGTTNFLSVPSFLAISDELEQKAAHKQVSGVHDFNGSQSELEFELLDDHESFKLTHTVGGSTPRTLAAAASSSLDFSMRFFTAEGRDVRSVIPDIEDIETLKKVTISEVNAARRKARRRAVRLPKVVPIATIEVNAEDSTLTNRVDSTIDEEIRISRAADTLAMDSLLANNLDQDGFDAPNAGAA